MKSLSIIFYAIGSILLIVSCFTTGSTVTWILGCLSIVALILGCVFQFKSSTRSQQVHHRH